MPERPFLKFFPESWRANSRLGLCSPSARGLWIELICIMHHSEPYGHLIHNGEPYSHTELCRLARVTEDELRDGLAELRRHGVFSETEDGIIFSRRMVRDEALRAKRADSGRRGGESFAQAKGRANVQAKGRAFAQARSSSSSSSSSLSSVKKERGGIGGERKQKEPAPEAVAIRDSWNERRSALGLNVNDSPRQTLKWIERRHGEGNDWLVLQRCADRYFDECEAMGTEARYLYKITNFFGEAAHYERYLANDWVCARPQKGGKVKSLEHQRKMDEYAKDIPF